MDKEKEIEEMSKEIGRALGVTYEGERLPFTIHTRNYLAKELVEAGYRTSDEVRKETIKKCSAWLRENATIIDEENFARAFDIAFGIEV